MKNSYPEISTLRAFLLTAREGSTAGAAKLLDVSQPAVSTSIQRLEKIVGMPLFDRSSRPMQLTVAGRALKNRVEPIVAELDIVSKEMRNIASCNEIDLRVGFSDSFSGCFSPLLLHRLLPKIKNLQAYGQSTPKILQKFLSDKVDIAVATKYPNENPDVNSMPLFSESFLIVTPKALEGRIHSIHDVSYLPHELPVIRFNDESLDSIQIERVLRQCNIKGGRVIAADSNSSVLSLVKNGAGWTVMTPLSLFMAQDQMENVAFHEVENLHASRTFYVMYKHGIHAPLAQTIRRESLTILNDDIVPAIRQYSTFLIKHISPAIL